MEITYSSTRRDQWRCKLYVMLHWPQAVLTQLLTLIGLLILDTLVAKSQSLWVFLIAVLVTLTVWVLHIALLLHAMIVKRLPTPTSRRIFTTTIGPESFQDLTPDKSYSYSWVQITAIRLHHGDFYFWVGGTILGWRHER